MSKKRQYGDGNTERKSKKRFQKGLRIYLLILSLLLCGALAVLWTFLSRYQDRQDKLAQEAALLAQQQAHEKAVFQAPQRCFEAFLEGTDAAYWSEEWFKAHPDSPDVKEKVQEKLNELFFGENTVCYKAKDFRADVPEYVIKNGEEQLATVQLQGSELDWSVKAVTLDLEGKESASLEVPAGCTVYCNGVKLDSPADADSHSYFEMSELEESLRDPIRWFTYRVEGLLLPPELTAEAPADKTLVTNEDGSMRYVLSADAAAAYQKQGEQMIRTLLYYYMQGGSNTAANMSAVLALVVPGSPAYRLINDSYNGVTWDATYPDATYETNAGDVVLWADNCMSMEVQYHSEGTKGGYTNVADGTYVLYFLDSGSGYGICGLAYK